MNITQLNYAKTKALYEANTSALSKEVNPIVADIVSGKIPQEIGYNQIDAIEDKLGHVKITDIYFEAQKQLIEWGRSIIQKQSPSRYNQVKIVFDKYHNYPDVREKLLDLCFRLNS